VRYAACVAAVFIIERRLRISNPRLNEQIRISPVRLIDAEGTLRGVVPTEEALRVARESGMDLVEVSPNERPPVCKVMDYGKFKYLQSKKLKQKHHEQKLKEVRIRPKTDPHDKEIKLARARDFLDHGDRVQFTMLFRGRERVHRDIGLEAFNEIAVSLHDIAKVEQPAKLLGRRMVMILVPGKPTIAVKKPKPASTAPSIASGTGASVRPATATKAVEAPAAVMAAQGEPQAVGMAQSSDSDAGTDTPL